MGAGGEQTDPKVASDSRSGLAPVLAFGIVACVLYGLGAGLRGDIGILLEPLMEHCNASYQQVSLCIAVMNLVFGAAQPAFGILAARRSNRFVLLIGVALLCAGLVGMTAVHTFAGLLVSLGLLFGAGVGALAFGLILSSAIRRVGPERALLIAGMLNAAAGLGAFVLSPTLQALLSGGGVGFALTVMVVPVLLLVPVTFLVTSADPKRPSRVGTPGITARDEALGDAAQGEAAKEGAAGSPGCSNALFAAIPSSCWLRASAPAGFTW